MKNCGCHLLVATFAVGVVYAVCGVDSTWTGGGAADPPSIDQGSVTLTKTGSYATVTYRLTGAPAIVTLDVQTNTLDNGAGEWVSIGGENVQTLEGDVNCIVRGTDVLHSFRWKANADFPDQLIKTARIRAELTAWATNAPPDWLVVGLQKSHDVRFYATTNYLPGGFSDRRYKTTELLMHKIPAAGVVWRMGAPTNEMSRSTSGETEANYHLRLTNETTRLVMLTEDYYMGVFEATQAQTTNISPNTFTLAWTDALAQPKLENSELMPEDIDLLPMGGMRHTDLRGSGVWPQLGRANVAANSVIGKLRTISGLDGFDLPTEAQWEYACRAGTETAFCNGKTASQANGEEVGWVSSNSNWVDETKKQKFAHPVGHPDRCNAFMLYDMHGNIQESCVDRGAVGDDLLALLAPDYALRGVTVDPIGPSSWSTGYDSRCLRRGGSVAHTWKDARSGAHNLGTYTASYYYNGFRLWHPAVFK